MHAGSASGQTLDYTDAGDENRKLCSSLPGVVDRMDVKFYRFGDADERLAGS